MADFQQRPFSIRVFLPDGDPDGVRLIEKSNWTGLGIVFNRSDYKNVLSRPEFDRTGVYLLVGGTEESTLPTIYIGEGDSVKSRLNQHYSEKDFWEWAVVFVTKDDSLNKAHVRRLEWQLLKLSRAAKQCRLDNGNMPAELSLSEADTAEMDSFLLDMLSIFPLLGLGIFEKTEKKSEPHELFYISGRGVKANGYEDAKGFVILRGSQMAGDEVPSLNKYNTAARDDLIQQGIVAKSGDHYVFTQDHVFTSPSKAGAVVTGRPSAGRTEWKTSDGRTLKEVQASAVSKYEAEDE